jgi:replication factor C subunit 3/5
MSASSQNEIQSLHVQVEQGFALVDILREVHPYLFGVDLPNMARRDLVAALADIEDNLSVGTNQRLQLAAVVAAFAECRAATVQAGAA